MISYCYEHILCAVFLLAAPGDTEVGGRKIPRLSAQNMTTRSITAANLWCPGLPEMFYLSPDGRSGRTRRLRVTYCVSRSAADRCRRLWLMWCAPPGPRWTASTDTCSGCCQSGWPTWDWSASTARRGNSSGSVLLSVLFTRYCTGGACLWILFQRPLRVLTNTGGVSWHSWHVMPMYVLPSFCDSAGCQ